MILEIRTYRLKPGTREDFVRIMAERALPMLAEYGIDVVDHGPSLFDEDGAEEAYLMRAFASLAERDRLEDAFYSSRVWREGPREEIVSRIDSYHTIVIETPDAAVAALRRDGA